MILFPLNLQKYTFDVSDLPLSYAGVGVESAQNEWANDTNKFDDILTKLKVVWRVAVPLFSLYE